MDEMVSYIFGTLKMSENAIKDINKFLKRQGKLNKRFGAFAVATVAWMYVSEKKNKEERELMEDKLNAQTKIIEKMNRDIMSLKIKKGEASM